MQPRSLEQILAELDNTAGYGAQTQSLRSQQALIPQQIAEEEKGLQARQTQSFDDILGGARRRGMGFSGIPLQEQAKYTATEFLPAMARLRTQGRQQAHSLEDAILGIQERRTTAGLGIRDNEQKMAEQRRQFNESLALQKQQEARQAAAARASQGGNSWMKALMGGKPGQAPAAQISRKQDGGFAFSDQGGNPISAAKYAQLNKQDVRDVLYEMGQAGDKYSQQLYNQFVKDPFFGKGNAAYDKKFMQTYSPIFWGTF